MTMPDEDDVDSLSQRIDPASDPDWDTYTAAQVRLAALGKARGGTKACIAHRCSAGMNYVVRALGAEDVDEFRRVRLDALRLHPEAFIASYEDECILDRVQFAERLAAPGLTRFGAFAHEEMVGLVGLQVPSGTKVRHKRICSACMWQTAIGVPAWLTGSFRRSSMRRARPVRCSFSLPSPPATRRHSAYTLVWASRSTELNDARCRCAADSMTRN